MTRPHVLIVGASGVFGSRLARLLAGRQAFRVTLAGRNVARTMPLQAELIEIDPQGGYDAMTLDRDTVTALELRALGCRLVVDCSGPFQSMGTNLVETAIAAPCHYIDLADSRSFIAAISRFDAAAKKAGTAVISGASSSPCLSNAVLDHLTGSWTSVDTVDCAIVPGNQTPKGKSVVDGILSWVGQPVRVFREGEWQFGAGWTEARTIAIDGVSPRRAMLAEVPDLDVIPQRFSPRLRAGFDAGMELGLLNTLIGLSGFAVRLKLVRTARAFSTLGNLIANALDRFGSQDGGMLVEVVGVDGEGKARRSAWQLRASKGHGPYVPIGPAAALVEALLLSGNVIPGANHAAGRVALGDILPWYSGLSIETKHRTETCGPSLFETVLGASFAQLPAVTQKLHRGWPAIVANGNAVVRPADTILGRAIARIFGLPARAGECPLRVTIESRDGQEFWSRRFGTHRMRSVMREEAGLVVERFGPVSIAMHLVATPEGLDMRPVRGRLVGIPLPHSLLPSVVAKETSGDGNHEFEVDIALPVIGRLVAYHGSLVV
jgi:NAD(P)-dependent dehydrogenase (short-subunit alcohol dehydrogenase family)